MPPSRSTLRRVRRTPRGALSRTLPGLIGGSTDLSSSNMTKVKHFDDFPTASPRGQRLSFGIQEHSMAVFSNGITLHSPGFVPFCASFFVFSDYMRAAMRMSALSQAGVIYVMNHDSIGLGEDGLTHQPVEHLLNFRVVPSVLVLRTADGNETAGAYQVAALNMKWPSLLALLRQKLPQLAGTCAEGVEKGGYVVSDNSSSSDSEIILIGTGSEPWIAEKAAEELREEGRKVRVVLLVCWELFEVQSEEYKESVLLADVTTRVSVTAGSMLRWEKYVGEKVKAVGIDRFGASVPARVLYKKFGLTVENVVAVAKPL